MLPQWLVVSQILQEEPQITSIPVTRQQHTLTFFFLTQGKPAKGKHQRRGNLAKLHVQWSTYHPIVGHHDGLGQMKMEVRIVGVTCGELPSSNVHRFVRLTLGPRRVKHDFIFLGDRVSAQPLPCVKIVTQLILGERLGAFFELGATHPLPHAVLRAKAQTSLSSNLSTMRCAISSMLPLTTLA